MTNQESHKLSATILTWSLGAQLIQKAAKALKPYGVFRHKEAQLCNRLDNYLLDPVYKKDPQLDIAIDHCAQVVDALADALTSAKSVTGIGIVIAALDTITKGEFKVEPDSERDLGKEIATLVYDLTQYLGQHPNEGVALILAQHGYDSAELRYAAIERVQTLVACKQTP